MENKTTINGAMSALITPFYQGKIHFETYEKLLLRQIRNGMDACVPVGTTGESATLSHKEHMECIEVAVSVCKGSNTKVLAGAGSNATQEAIELAQFAQKCGADRGKGAEFTWHPHSGDERIRGKDTSASSDGYQCHASG